MHSSLQPLNHLLVFHFEHLYVEHPPSNCHSANIHPRLEQYGSSSYVFYFYVFSSCHTHDIPTNIAPCSLVALRSLDILELCIHLILVQEEKM